jgi:hypothetical protein
MIDDGVKGQGVGDDEVQVADISMHLLEAIQKGEADALSALPPGAHA